MYFWENVNVDEVTSSDVEVYERTSRELVELYHLVAEGSTPNTKLEQAIVTFLHTVFILQDHLLDVFPDTKPLAVPRRFVELLDRQKPIAMALWVRNVALLNLFDTSGSWWIQGSGDCRVAHRAVYGIRNRMPSSMMWAMDWSLKVILGEIKLGSDTALDFQFSDYPSPLISRRRIVHTQVA